MASCWATPSSAATRHRPRDGGGHYSQRELPEDLLGSEEAADVWEAAKTVSSVQRLIEVRGWRVEWRPRTGVVGGGHGSGAKRGDLYLFPPKDDHGTGSHGGRPIRSLSALGDVLALRYAAQQAGGSVWTPPVRGSLVEVRLSADEVEAERDASDDDVERLKWRRADVRKVELGLGGSFQVCVHDVAGEPDESCMRWCTAWDECTAWRRIPGQPLFARTRPGKRRGRCGECVGCLATDCGRCAACVDKPKFGGRGTAKQACVQRRCTNPTLPLGSATASEDVQPPPSQRQQRQQQQRRPNHVTELLHAYVAEEEEEEEAAEREPGALPPVVNGVQLIAGVQ